MSYTRETIPCQVQGHDHMCTYLRTETQINTEQMAWIVQCPKAGNYRFMHIVGYHGNLYPIENMPRFQRPRWGWPDEDSKATTKANSTRYKGTTLDEMGY